MRFTMGIITGMVVALGASIACACLFPNAKHEMCDCVKRVSKDMEKDLENMM